MGSNMRRIRAAVVAATLVTAAAAASTSAAATEAADHDVVVTGAVQVTRNPDPTRAHSSPQLARNPVTGELVIVESEVRSDLGCAVHISGDGGRSWSPGGNPMLAPWTECSQKTINGPYATLAFDREGVLYVTFYASDPAYANDADLPLHIFLARSEDGGRTFETNFVHRSPEPVEENEGLHNNDRPMIAVDESDPDNVYVAWMQRGGEDEPAGKALIAASTDGGRTFAEPVELSDERGGYQPRPAVTPDGTVHAIYPIGLDAAPEGVAPFDVVRHLYYLRSTDNGQTWSEPVLIEEGNAGFYGGRKWWLAADQSNGNLYAVWYGNAEPVFDPQVEDVDIFLRYSHDGGDTWSDRITVNDDADSDLVNHYNPGIAIAPNGRVDIAWYDFRNSPYPEQFPDGFAAPFNHGGYQDVYYSWSNDGGRSWAPNVRVTDRAINREIGVWSNNVHSHLNVGIASTNDAVFLAWQDSRNGTPANNAEDIYAASVAHGGAPGAVGAAEPNPALVLAAGGAGLALGLGVAMIAAWSLSRRPARARQRT